MRTTLFIGLVILSVIFVCAGALIAYWLVHEQFGYYGNKSTVFYIGGAFVGYLVTEPLWKLYRRRFPKA